MSDDRLDTAQARDNAPMVEPAAAPLGADAEAGGASARANEAAQERLRTATAPKGDKNSASPLRTPSGDNANGAPHPFRRALLWLALVIAAAAFAAFVLLD